MVKMKFYQFFGLLFILLCAIELLDVTEVLRLQFIDHLVRAIRILLI